jgi:Fe-S-cluster containining protein
MLRDAVMQAATNRDLRAAVARVYENLQREIDARKPVCNASGRCCRFDEFGHRLYVTTIELAAFVASLPEAAFAGSAVPNVTPPHQENNVRHSRTYGGGCPFQVNGLCSVHAIRPFGCRVFFCDATSDDWQHQQYERFHAELKRLHAEFEVPYQYVEWRDALRQLDLEEGLPLAVSRSTSASEPGLFRETASGSPSQSRPKHLSLPQLPL